MDLTGFDRTIPVLFNSRSVVHMVMGGLPNHRFFFAVDHVPRRKMLLHQFDGFLAVTFAGIATIPLWESFIT